MNDITVYLAEDDYFKDLEETLHKWYKTSGAKFNILKTVIILIGLRHSKAG